MTITIGESNVQLLPERPTSKSNHGNKSIVPRIGYSTTLLRDLEVSCSTVVTAHVNKTCIHTRAHRHDTQRCSIMLDRRWCFSLGLHGRIMGGGVASSDERPPHASSPHAGTPHRPLRTLGQARRMWHSRRKECAVHIMRLE